MILKSLKLNNIRSYTNQEINFPEGSVLLSGDIGSGKSSILLAIEFALFGIRRKHLSGASLLRHGKKEGSVELRFELEGKDIIIKRTLKRGKKDISQETGYIVIDGKKKEATAIELKTILFNLLGYPSELVTKSRDLIYRYTIYTPQEEMRRIVLDDKDVRLNTLRKVFNIDKYKRIRENSIIFVRELKERKKESQGRIADLEEKKKEKKEKEDETSTLDIKIKELKPKLEKVKRDLEEKKERVRKTEKDVQEFNKLKQELELNELRLKNNLDKREKNKKNIQKLDKQIKELEKEIGTKEEIILEVLLENVKEKEKQIELIEKTIKEITAKINEFSIKKEFSNNIKEKISNLKKCPTCYQEVDDMHKEKILERENELLKELEDSIKVYKNQHKEAENKKSELKKEYDYLKTKENNIKIIKLKLKNLEEKIKEKEELIKLQDEIKKDIGRININKRELSDKVRTFKDIEKIYEKEKKEVTQKLEEEKKLEIETVGLEKEKQAIQKMILSLEKEINEKMKIKKNLVYTSQLQNWLEKHFINLMSVVEKHVMLNVYREFNELFQQWFNMLIEDETLNVRLDDEFTPTIEQNGYETAIENLSGGERTSVALSYRLALNKVINDIIEDIKTRDLLILDEPTDGFSSEQLDKVRDVLDQLNLKQTIIVSHESKIESFVDNVINVSKEEHVSSVMGP